jgi:hypothetical protein
LDFINGIIDIILFAFSIDQQQAVDKSSVLSQISDAGVAKKGQCNTALGRDLYNFKFLNTKCSLNTLTLQ